VPIVLKSGSLNLQETLWRVLACNGVALPFEVFCISIAAISISWIEMQKDFSFTLKIDSYIREGNIH